jgi:hypothetical protein
MYIKRFLVLIMGCTKLPLDCKGVWEEDGTIVVNL